MNRLFLLGPPDSGKTILRNMVTGYEERNKVAGQADKKYNEIIDRINNDPETLFSTTTIKSDDRVVIMFRDPRLGYLLTRHKSVADGSRLYSGERWKKRTPLEWYCLDYILYFNVLKQNLNNSSFLFVKFEEALSDYMSFAGKVLSFLDLDIDDSIKSRAPTVYTKHLTKFDVNEYFKWWKKVKQKEFDYINGQLQELIDYFNYPKEFDKMLVVKK